MTAVVGVIVYRVSVYAMLVRDDRHMGAVSLGTSATAALLNLIVIMLLSKVLTLSLPRVINLNFLFQSLTRDISYSMENLAIGSLLG